MYPWQAANLQPEATLCVTPALFADLQRSKERPRQDSNLEPGFRKPM